jgi:protein tyrosine phosphatase (PTP) superfamily phosphohydrolase (DUF442 family)
LAVISTSENSSLLEMTVGATFRSRRVRIPAPAKVYVRGYVRFGRITLAVLALKLHACAYTPELNAADPCPDHLNAPIREFCVVTPDVLWRGSKPDRDDATWLIQQGVATIVNLELLHDDKHDLDQASPRGNGVTEVGYFRVRDWEPLKLVTPRIVDDHIAHFLAIIAQQPKPIYVHCRYGQDRTGAMIAVFRMLIEGVSEEDAIAELRRNRGNWLALDEKYIRGLSPSHLEEIRRKMTEWIPKLKMDARVVCSNGACAIADAADNGTGG